MNMLSRSASVPNSTVNTWALFGHQVEPIFDTCRSQHKRRHHARSPVGNLEETRSETGSLMPDLPSSVSSPCCTFIVTSS